MMSKFIIAQEVNVQDVVKDSLSKDVLKISEKDLKQVDSLWMDYVYKNTVLDSVVLSPITQESLTINMDVELSTDTLKARLKKLNQKTPFHIAYNPSLERVIKSYLKTRKKYYPQLMERAAYYFPLFEEKLAQFNLPLEIKYLAVVESALKPTIKSRVGATGLWQFMYQTGKLYNLKVSSYVDERQDPVKSTIAACQFLEKLYHMFHDWDLALAAYNSGPGNVTKAIRRSGNHLNYWNIRPFLPRETAGYLPAFYANLYIFEYAKEHGIAKEIPDYYAFQTDSIQVKQLLTFQQIHDKIGTDIETLEFLNPSYKLNIVPYIHGRNYKLVLPYQDAKLFAKFETEIYAYATAEAAQREKPLPKYFEMSQKLRYKVRSGDYLGLIAKRFGVYVKDIKRWNRLRSNNLQIGQRLTIYPKKRGYVAQSKDKPKPTIKKIHVPKKGNKTLHTVVQGETLWSVSKKYQVSIEALRSWNNLWAHDHLKLGQQLEIYALN